MVDKKFKFNRISVNFVVKMNSKEVSSNELLSFLLRKRCQQYPNMLDLGKKLQQLYGANLFSGCKKIGDNQVITFGISSLDDELSLNGEDLTNETLRDRLLKLTKLMITIRNAGLGDRLQIVKCAKANKIKLYIRVDKLVMTVPLEDHAQLIG